MKIEMKTIKRRRLTDQIVDQLVSLIGSGKLKKGDKLPPERELMKQLGVGRSSLREATGALILTGVLTSHPGHGTYVTVSPHEYQSRPFAWYMQMGREKIEELVEARIVLEQAIVGLAATKNEEADIAEIRNYLGLMKSLKKNYRKFFQADLSYHFALAKASHNDTLFGFLSELRHLMQLWLKQTVRPERIYGIDDIIKDHEEVLDAVEAHDVERAQSELYRHLKMSANNLSFILLDKQLKSGVVREI